MEGIRMVDEWPIIEKKIPSFDMVFRPAIDHGLIEVGAVSGPDQSGAARRVATTTGRIRLAPDEERVFRKVDGVRTVQAIIDATGAGEFEVCRTLFDFLNRNLITPAGRGATTAADEGVAATVASSGPAYAVAALVALLAVGGAWFQRGAPFAVTGLPSVLPRSLSLVKDGVTRSRLARVEQAIEAWRAGRGAPPPTLEDLARAGLVDRSYLLDPWRRPLHYEPGPTGYLLSAVDGTGRSRPDATIDRRGGR
jgi:hypothetical protein